MTASAIDTNVLLVASAFEVASPFTASDIPVNVQEASFEWLCEFADESKAEVLLDEETSILDEYRGKLARRGEQDFGFRVIIDKITKGLVCWESIERDHDGHAKLPGGLQKAVKDRADRKFVAVCLPDPASRQIVNATDTDWYDAEEALTEWGVRVKQVANRWCRRQWEVKRRRSR